MGRSSLTFEKEFIVTDSWDGDFSDIELSSLMSVVDSQRAVGEV